MIGTTQQGQSSGQDSVVHLHLKEKNHSFEDNNKIRCSFTHAEFKSLTTSPHLVLTEEVTWMRGEMSSRNWNNKCAYETALIYTGTTKCQLKSTTNSFLWCVISVEDEFRSLTTWEKKLLCSRVVWQQKLTSHVWYLSHILHVHEVTFM